MILRWGDERTLDGLRPPGNDVARLTLTAGLDERWQHLDAPERFAEWAALVVGRFSEVHRWITVSEPNGWAVDRYAGGWRWLETRPLLRALDHQLAGHVLATQILRTATTSTVEVGLPLVAHDAYELHRMLDDIVGARDSDIDRGDIGTFLADRRAQYERDHPARTPRARLRRRIAASVLPLDQALPRAIAAVYETPRVTT